MVVSQQFAKTLVALDGASNLADLLARLNDPVLEALVITLLVVVGQEMADGVPERFLAEEDQAVQALGLQRSAEPFHGGIQIGRAGWEQD